MLSRAALFLVSLVAGLLALELGLRAWDGYLGDWSNLVLDARTVLAKTEGQRFTHDELLGYVPRGGTRGNGVTGAVINDPLILAVGDSYTYGEEVDDETTWPAFLQNRLSRPVVNGGVSGYGFDQIVLRTELLATAIKPATIVVSFIADDILRTEMSRMWGADKPYFDLTGDGQLVLRNVPVPPRPEPRSTLSVWQRTLGYSYLFDFALRRLGLLHNWFGDHVRVHPEGAGEAIACRLTDRLIGLQRRSGAHVLVLAQYDPVVWQDEKFAAEQRRLTGGLLACARRNGLATLDSFDVLARGGRRHGLGREPLSLYKRWHMNEVGNRVIAEIVAAALDGNGH